MPWAEAILRGQKVFARVHASGDWVATNGRVEIRYKPNDGRMYQAATSNLAKVEGKPLLPDEHCGLATALPNKQFDPKPNLIPKWIVYTDGACSGNPGPAGCGVVVVDPSNGKMHEGYEYLGQATNNIAELMAIFRALDVIKDPEAPVVIHTDSSYSIGVLQKGWKAKANTELITQIRGTLLKRTNTRLVYVPGHAGVPLNEKADELAREAIRTRSSRTIVLDT